MTSTLLSATDLRNRIQQHLAADLLTVNQILQRQLSSSSVFVSDVVQHVSRYRGKQIRPVLLLLMSRLESGQSSERAQMLAAAVEAIHLATLVHDDVIDESETRRHVATVHRRWNTETSVLLGDFLFSRAFHLSAATGDAAACALIGRATDRTCEGELHQIAARLEQSTSERDYFRIIRGKTGHLFALSCQLGMRSSGASAQNVRAAARFGMRLGLAFQIADDVLDVTQSATSTGKDEGNDLQNGRRTLPVLRALTSAAVSATASAQDDLRLLNEWLRGERTMSQAEFRSLPSVQTGIQSSLNTADLLIERAVRDLQTFPETPDRRLLEAIAGFAIQRDQ
ncbi:MAG: polyprenyl synthetase family protein [Planctomycetaceae bacterium]